MSNLRVENIKKQFEDKIILDNVNLEVESEKITVLLGPSGCGKSTLLKIISGITLQDAGKIILDSKDISNIPIHKRNSAMIFQEQLLFPHLTVFENIAFGLKMRKVNKNIIKDKVMNLLDVVKLPNHKNHYPSELSGGQKQRVVFARALAIQPELLLLDEPFSGLDPELRIEMRNLLKDIQKTTKTTMLMVTHDKDEAFILGDKVAIMFEKNIEQFDTPENIYFYPKTKKVANFFGKVSYIYGSVDKNFFKGSGFKIKLKHTNNGRNFSLLVRPEYIVPDSYGNECTVIGKEFYGDRIMYYLQSVVNGTKLYMVTSSDYNYNVSDMIGVNIKEHDYILFE